jgi:hypothetical protein
LLSASAGQLQFGCAHFLVSLILIASSTYGPGSTLDGSKLSFVPFDAVSVDAVALGLCGRA